MAAWWRLPFSLSTKRSVAMSNENVHIHVNAAYPCCRSALLRRNGCDVAPLHASRPARRPTRRRRYLSRYLCPRPVPLREIVAALGLLVVHEKREKMIPALRLANHSRGTSPFSQAHHACYVTTSHPPQLFLKLLAAVSKIAGRHLGKLLQKLLYSCRSYYNYFKNCCRTYETAAEVK